ncbi:Retrotransposon gag protein [Arachis hypogaea]|nr:Retrotransposon gag protein [Arachis hypogaea]
MTSEDRRRRMAHVTARNGEIAMTRTHGLESAQMTRARGRRGRVTSAFCKNTENAGGNFWAFSTQFLAQKTQTRSCRMDKSSSPHPSTEDLLINSILNTNLIF